MGGEDPNQVGPPAAPTDPHAPNAFHYPQEAVHDPAAAERAAQEAAVRAPPPAGGAGQVPQPAEQAAAPEQPPLQPA